MTPTTNHSNQSLSPPEDEEEGGVRVESAEADSEMKEPTNDDADEKDAQDRLTPAAMVHAASGIELHRPNIKNVSLSVKNDSDLKEKKSNEDDDDEENMDQLLASVPPSLERQPAVPSQPGAFPSRGATMNANASVVSSDAQSATMIEATLVVAPEAPPVYKGQIVEEEEEEEDGAVVKLTKKQVRCFVLTFTMVCVVAIALAVGLSVAFVGNDDENPPERDRENSFDKGGEERFWYEDEPQLFWEKVQDYPYITHHTAVVSIVHPQIDPATGDDGPLVCTALQNNFDKENSMQSNDNPEEGSGRRFLGKDGRRSDYGFDSSSSDKNVMVVSFVCGDDSSSASSPNSLILFHEVLSSDMECKDAKREDRNVTYNEVFCLIPTNGGDLMVDASFVFSCFSRVAPTTVATVELHDAVVHCHVARNSTSEEEEEEDDVPQVVVTRSAAAVVSTQRLCRTVDNSIVLQSPTPTCTSILEETEDFPVCLSQSNTTLVNTSVAPLEDAGDCPDVVAAECFGRLFPLANVTLYDRFKDEACTFTSLQDSLLQRRSSDRDLPLLQPLSNANLLESAQEQEEWAEQRFRL